jgi:hypothetical protein
MYGSYPIELPLIKPNKEERDTAELDKIFDEFLERQDR